MIYFLLPSAPKHIFQNISVLKRDTDPTEVVSQSLCKYINEIKEKIASREKEWDVYKKYTNPYEYIHSVIPNKKRAVAKYKPISRSYFKMIEIMTTFQLHLPVNTQHINISRNVAASGLKKAKSAPTLSTTTASRDYESEIAKYTGTIGYEDRCEVTGEDLIRECSSSSDEWQICKYDNKLKKSALQIDIPVIGLNSDKRCELLDPKLAELDSMRSFHLAEGPGGFIEAVCNKRSNANDRYYGMTILIDETDDNVPGWNKTSSFLEKHPNIQIEVGADGTGNILHIENFDYCVSKYASSMDLITADGGFDFSKDFNKQEISIMHLLWAQVCYAVCLQKCGGNFVLKIFDIFHSHTIDILYILAGFYSEVNVCKLQTSRIGNSEKYVVCKGFRFENNREFLSIIRESFVQIKDVGLEKLRPLSYAKPKGYFTIDEVLVAPPGLSLSREAHSRIAKYSGRFASEGVTSNYVYSSMNPSHVWRLLNVSVPRHFTKQIEDVNALFGQQQIENIHYTLSLIDKHAKCDKTDQLTKQNITKCINWCIEHKVPYYTNASSNVFVSSTADRNQPVGILV